MAADPDDLAAWIAELRGRVARGDLAGLGTLAVGGGTLPVARAARIMLADLDHYDDLPLEHRREPPIVARRLRLLADLRELRARIG